MTLAATVDANGISAPDYQAILTALQVAYTDIYGSDAILTPDSQDGQFLSIFAAAINDANQAAIAVYNSFAPTFAVGAGLSSVVKLNGIVRRSATHSTVDVTLTGGAGTQVVNGAVTDTNGNRWNLPALVTIDVTGTVDATATAADVGAISAGAGTVTGIATPTRGWQSVTNAVAATVGVAVETDAELRRRQIDSVSLPAQAIILGIVGAIGGVTGVSRYRVYENDTDIPNSDAIPAHSISAVVAGGDATAIATAIFSRKPPGVQTYGSTAIVVIDSRGEPDTIHFYPLSSVPITVEITLAFLAGWVATTGDMIKAAVALYLNRLSIGEDVYVNRLFAPASLSGQAAVDATGLTQAQLDAYAETFHVTLIRQKRGAGALAAADIVIAFNEAAAGSVATETLLP